MSSQQQDVLEIRTDLHKTCHFDTNVLPDGSIRKCILREGEVNMPQYCAPFSRVRFRFYGHALTITSSQQQQQQQQQQQEEQNNLVEFQDQEVPHHLLMSDVHQDRAHTIDSPSTKKGLPPFFNTCLRTMRQGEMSAFLIRPEHTADQFPILGPNTESQIGIHALFVFEMRQYTVRKDTLASLSNNTERLKYSEEKRLKGNDCYEKKEFKKAFFLYLDAKKALDQRDHENDKQLYARIRKDRFTIHLNLAKTCLQRFAHHRDERTQSHEEREAERSKWLDDGIRFASSALRIDKFNDKRYQAHHIVAQSYRIKFSRDRVFSHLDNAKKSIDTAIELLQQQQLEQQRETVEKELEKRDQSVKLAAAYERERSVIDALISKQSNTDESKKRTMMQKMLGSLYEDRAPDDEWERLLREDEENERKGKKLWSVMGPGASSWYTFEGGRSHGKPFWLEQEQTEEFLRNVTIERGFHCASDE